MIEFEAKILNVNPADIEQRILAAGGTKVAERLMRRNVYDIVPGDMTRWIRLRDTGTEVTITTKHIRHDGIDGTDEVEVRVDDFDNAHALLEMQGFTAKAYQENRRTSYVLDGVEVEIDEWPLIPAYMEIEGSSRDEVVATAALIGFGEDELTGENTTKVYARYGIDLAGITVLRFEESK